ADDGRRFVLVRVRLIAVLRFLHKAPRVKAWVRHAVRAHQGRSRPSLARSGLSTGGVSTVDSARRTAQWPPVCDTAPARHASPTPAPPKPVPIIGEEPQKNSGG